MRRSEHKILAVSNQARGTDLHTQHVGGRPPADDINAEIITVLRKFPCPSVRTIADSLNIPASTIYTHLVEEIDFKIFTSLGTPHINY
jgi:hypothetical protein